MSNFTGGGGTGIAGGGEDGALRGSEELSVRTLEDILEEIRGTQTETYRFSAGGGLVPIDSVKAIMKAEMEGKCRLSRETKQKLALIMRKSKRRDTTNHHSRRKARRRLDYFRTERSSKLARDDWMRTTPDGSWYLKGYRAKAKGLSWDISKEDWVELVSQRRVDNGLPIYMTYYDVSRRDKSSKSLSKSNIVLLDRTTKEPLLGS